MKKYIKISRNKTSRIKSKNITHSSYQWLNRQLNDPYVSQSKIDGYRSRSAYKIMEIDKKFSIFKSGMRVVDLGAAPGGWSQVVSKIVGPNNVIAIDLLKMEPIPGVIDILGDFYHTDIQNAILDKLSGNKSNIIMSDMAPNAIGHRKTDHFKIIDLYEHSMYFAIKNLSLDGVFIAKILIGGVEHKLLKIMQQHFKLIKHFKPHSSRSHSREMYVIAKGFIC